MTEEIKDDIMDLEKELAEIAQSTKAAVDSKVLNPVTAIRLNTSIAIASLIVELSRKVDDTNDILQDILDSLNR